jgi:hypothetical protein
MSVRWMEDIKYTSKPWIKMCVRLLVCQVAIPRRNYFSVYLSPDGAALTKITVAYFKRTYQRAEFRTSATSVNISWNLGWNWLPSGTAIAPLCTNGKTLTILWILWSNLGETWDLMWVKIIKEGRPYLTSIYWTVWQATYKYCWAAYRM